jgi:hypothetical protein
MAVNEFELRRVSDSAAICSRLVPQLTHIHADRFSTADALFQSDTSSERRDALVRLSHNGLGSAMLPIGMSRVAAATS